MPDDSSSHSGFNYQHAVYLRARDESFARSKGTCQFCGQQDAVEAHHWAVDYPPVYETTANDLTALCADCHFLATTLRRFTRAGGSRHQFCALLSEVIERCCSTASGSASYQRTGGGSGQFPGQIRAPRGL